MPSEAERDELVMMLVESALERPPESRDEYLRSACGSNPELYQEVRERIGWEDRLGDFLRVPLIERVHAAEQPFQPGELVSGRFRMIRVAGRGGMGIVYEAMDEKLDRRIAIKCAKLGFQNRLPPEARSAREVSHYHVCKVHELHTAQAPSGQIDFLTMEFVEGETLAARISRQGPLKDTEAREIALQICDGLAHAHRQGVIHGDLKCGNVILARTPAGGVRAVLTDFGLAKLGGAASFGRSERGGTLGYMAPELFLGQPMSVASDLYALGVIFHFMLAGKTPERFAPDIAPSGDTKAATVTLPVIREADWPIRISELPPPWNRVVARSLAADPAQRYSSAEEVAHALEDKSPARLWLAALALIVLLAVVVGLWQWRGQSGPPVRLAVLPVSVIGEPIPVAAGIVQDVAARLSGLRRNFLVIPPGEVAGNRVDSPRQAKAVLGANYALRTELTHHGAQIVALAQVVDTGSGETVRQLQATYAAADVSALAKAMAATVAGAFHARAPVESVSPTAYPYYAQGVALMRRDLESADEAIPFFQKAIQLDPRSALPYAGLADAQLQKFENGHGRQWLDTAGETIAKARSLNPESVPVLLVSGHWNKYRSSYDKAVQDYARAAEIDPANWESWQLLADIYGDTNRPSDAVATYRKAVAAQPDYYVPYLNFGVFYFGSGQFNEAEKLFRQVTTLAPGLFLGHSNLGAILINLGRYQEAEQALLQSLNLRETFNVLVNLGALYNLEERPADALPRFERALELGPPTLTLYSNLGYTYRHLGRTRDAEEAYRKGRALAEEELTSDPRRPSSRSYLAVISAYLGDRNRAGFEIAQALALGPEDTIVMRHAAFTYEILKEREKTLEVLRNAPASLLSRLNREPELRSLQADSRFVELLAKKPDR